MYLTINQFTYLAPNFFHFIICLCILFRVSIANSYVFFDLALYKIRIDLFRFFSKEFSWHVMTIFYTAWCICFMRLIVSRYINICVFYVEFFSAWDFLVIQMWESNRNSSVNAVNINRMCRCSFVLLRKCQNLTFHKFMNDRRMKIHFHFCGMKKEYTLFRKQRT